MRRGAVESGGALALPAGAVVRLRGVVESFEVLGEDLQHGDALVLHRRYIFGHTVGAGRVGNEPFSPELDAIIDGGGGGGVIAKLCLHLARGDADKHRARWKADASRTFIIVKSSNIRRRSAIASVAILTRTIV